MGLSSAPRGPAPVLVVADGGAQASLGHLARCGAVAVALQGRGIPCRCVAVGSDAPAPSALAWEWVADADALPDTGVSLLLLDSYRLDPVTVRAHTGAVKLAVMHDIGPVPESADLVLTTDPGLAGMRPEIVGGPALCCLGPMFWGLPAPRPVAAEVRKVLITTGGGDPSGHGVAIAYALADALPGREITLVRGPHTELSPLTGIHILDRPPSLLHPLREADLTVTSAGNSLLEALAVGSPTVAVIVAENQRSGAQALADRGATQLAEPEPLEALEALVATVRALAEDPELRGHQVRAGRELVDGYGALRVAYLLSEL
ncbi:MAG: hypothetical protein ACRDNK_21500 [Solirubrobacteraceae bacterium]